MDFSVIFDLDGVIVDSNPYHQKAWYLFLKQHNIHLTEKELREKVFGRTGSEALKILFNAALSNDDIEKYTTAIDNKYRNLFRPYIKPLQGLENFLQQLVENKIEYAIATSAPPVNVEFVLSNTDLLDYFKVIIDNTYIINSKPHPEIYLKTAEILQQKPENCIAFEDSLSGIASAQNAGMKVIALATTHTKNELAIADFVINNFSEISLEILGNIHANQV